MSGWPNFASVALDLGTADANQSVKIRFRIGADESTGAPGWEIDDIAVSGLTDTPFSALVPNATTCPSDDSDDEGDVSQNWNRQLDGESGPAPAVLSRRAPLLLSDRLPAA